MTSRSGDAGDIGASIDQPSRFSGVFDRHVDAVHGYLARRAGRQVADDLVGEVFCVAFERRASFDLSRHDARPWLYGIAGNLLRRTWRSTRRRDAAFERAWHAGSRESTVATSVAEDAEGRERLRELATALEQLPEVDRDALLLHTWEQLSYEEVALAMEVPVGTVRSRIHRARTRLRELLGPSGQLPADTPLTCVGSTAADTDEGPNR
jgi:RNA polymerase sigma-70 factor (ECF subfamily)